jgi:DNA polymerase-3 subunit gamma/tau
MQLFEQHRPKAWGEFVGQDKAITKIRAVISRPGFDRGALLFQGPSGSGKTSAALVVARECGAADFHTEFVRSQECSIETVRKLAENMQYGACDGGWKAYIIDEAHLMSTAAHNALLSLAENLPAKRLIVLTTTETSCFEETLFSRLYVVDFAKPHSDKVTAHIQGIAESLGFNPNGFNWKRFVQDRHNNIRRCLSDLEIEIATVALETAA